MCHEETYVLKLIYERFVDRILVSVISFCFIQMSNLMTNAIRNVALNSVSFFPGMEIKTTKLKDM